MTETPKHYTGTSRQVSEYMRARDVWQQMHPQASWVEFALAERKMARAAGLVEAPYELA